MPLDLAVSEARLIEAAPDPGSEGLRERGQCARRQLLCADLGEEIAACHAVIGKPSASRLAWYASATPRARVRTRRM